MEPDESDFERGPVQVTEVVRTFRPLFPGTLVANGRFDKSRAEAVIVAGLADLVSFGRPFIANPDLPERFSKGIALSTPDFSTFYGEGPKGYVDYPTMASLGGAL